MTRTGLIGLGYWGPNLARVLNQSSRSQFIACCDLDARKVEKTIRQYPNLQGFESAEAFLDSNIEAVFIATPISSHYELAIQALRRGKHVFVEKPLADSFAKSRELVELAQNVGRTLMTGHTFVYSPPVVRVKELIDSGELGSLHYLSFSRVNLGLYQKDVDVVWDLAVHDVSILLYWLGEFPLRACSFGRSCVQKAKRDVAYLWFQFPSGVVASCEVSWLSPYKMRRTCVVGSKRMITYDDTEPSEKVKIYDRGVIFRAPESFGEFQLTYRMGDVHLPYLANVEPLLLEIEHFMDSIETKRSPRTDGQFGANVVAAIEMAINSSWVPEESFPVQDAVLLQSEYSRLIRNSQAGNTAST
ncbi:MAG TPA: Gfo/Idh/MocA family oxidoreductase [Candidatus Acidoferrum sp.]|nr:Gfo/Idh/MocA family oxidoreductase [Candidatus Acidoferrum sp.]